MLFCTNLFGQNLTQPIHESKKGLVKLIELSKRTDSIILESDKMEYRKKLFTTGASEGLIKIKDSLKFEIGSGGFTTYTYSNNKTNKIIKADYNQTVHYKYNVKDSLNANTERLEISIYYENEKAYYAKFNENHYDNKNLISANEYYFQLNVKRKEIYYSNIFQKRIIEYILKLSEEIISKD